MYMTTCLRPHTKSNKPKTGRQILRPFSWGLPLYAECASRQLDCLQAQKKGVVVLPPKRGTECLGHFTDALNINILYISSKFYKNGLLQKIQ